MTVIVLNESIIFAQNTQNQEFFVWMDRFVWKDCGGYLKVVSEKNFVAIRY